jgi:adenosyl cobinamide kinase/adenosyl cobinamide phosphate guanylyltransferase
MADLLHSIRDRGEDTVIVSDEVGMSVHPGSPAGRAFQDLIGKVNQLLAARADHTLLVVAGRIVTTAAVDIEAITQGRG